MVNVYAGQDLLQIVQPYSSAYGYCQSGTLNSPMSTIDCIYFKIYGVIIIASVWVWDSNGIYVNRYWTSWLGWNRINLS